MQRTGPVSSGRVVIVGTGGAVWAGVSGGNSVVLPFTACALFARALDPGSFGLSAVVVALAEMVKCLGLPGS